MSLGDNERISDARRWSILAASTLAQAASAVMINGAAFLIPTLHAQDGLSLGEAGVVAAAPTAGVLLTLVAWGWLTDRRGERLTMLAGLIGTAAFGAVATLAPGLPALAALLFLAGGCAASTSAASGRMVVGWFPVHRRGLAMGIRQMAQPVGVGIAAISMAVTAEAHGVRTALWIPVAASALAAAAVAAVVLDPPRPERAAATPTEEPAADANPYRGDSYLIRVHCISVLLVVPQFVVWTFALVWLVHDRHWAAGAAGALVAVAQLFGALGRIGAGQLSDVVRSRMRPLRWIAIAAAVTMALLGLTAGLGWFVAVPLIVVATVLTVADNGLAFTGVAERAGPYWAGRAMGLQNTAQYLAATAVPPVGGLAVAQLGFPWSFAVVALFPLLAIGLVPVKAERPLR